MPRLAKETKTVRIAIRIPVDTARDVERMVEEAGLYSSYFWGVAALMGARALLRMLVPEQFISAAMMDKAVQAFGLQLTEKDKALLMSKIREGGGDVSKAS